MTEYLHTVRFGKVIARMEKVKKNFVNKNHDGITKKKKNVKK